MTTPLHAADATDAFVTGSAAGTWKNAYGSVMQLAICGDQLHGHYWSSTGSSGLYAVIGCQGADAATAQHGRPVALAIGWRSLQQTGADPSGHWASALCGQLSMIDGEERLVLSHGMVASCRFAALADTGLYIDRLTYRRTAVAPGGKSLQRSVIVAGSRPPAICALTGAWRALDGSHLEVTVDIAEDNGPSAVIARLATPSTQLRLSGFTDSTALACGLAMQSVAMTASQPSAVLALCGTLDVRRDRMDLLQLTSTSTAPEASYLQTTLSSLSFRRGDTPGL